MTHATFIFLLLIFCTKSTSAGPTSDQNAQDLPDSGLKAEDSVADSEAISAQAAVVADALAKGLEDSVNDCVIDPSDPEGSIQRCLAEKDKLLDAPSSDESISDEGVEDGQRLLLLKTAFLNLNEQVKDQLLTTEDELANLLDKVDEVVTKAVDVPKNSTVVRIPTEAELEIAVTNQDYDHKGQEFWSALFSVSDKVAMSLLLRLKAVEREDAVKDLKNFLLGSDDERLKILSQTLKLSKRRFRAKPVEDKSKDEKSFIAYDERGVATDNADSAVKRSGLDNSDEFIKANQDLYSDESTAELLRRYGLDENSEGISDSDVGLNEADLDHLLEVEGLKLHQNLDDEGRHKQNLEYEPIQAASKSEDLHVTDNGHHAEAPKDKVDLFSGIVVDDLGRPIKRSGFDVPVVHESVNHISEPQIVEHWVPDEISGRETTLSPASFEHQHTENVLFAPSESTSHYHAHSSTVESYFVKSYYIYGTVASAVVLIILIVLYCSRAKVRRFYRKNYAYRRID